MKYQTTELLSVEVNRDKQMVVVRIPGEKGGSLSLSPAHARWLSQQLWFFAAEADGQEDAWSRRIKQAIYFG